MKILPTVAIALALASGPACGKSDDGAKAVAQATPDAPPPATCEQAYDNIVAIMSREQPEMAKAFAKMTAKEKAEMRAAAVKACVERYPKEYPACAVKATTKAEVEECDKLITRRGGN